MGTLKTKGQAEHKESSVSGYEAADDNMVYEQRLMPRWRADKKAFYRSQSGGAIVGTKTRNLSLTGACLYVAGNVRVNQKLNVNIYVNGVRNFKTGARVVWKASDNHNTYAGIVFDPLHEAAQKLILNNAFELDPLYRA